MTPANVSSVSPKWRAIATDWARSGKYSPFTQRLTVDGLVPATSAIARLDARDR